MHDLAVSEAISRAERALREGDPEGRFEEFNEYQRAALSKILGRLMEGDRVSLILQMPTGTGKTILATGLLLSLSMSDSFSKLFPRGVTSIFLSPRIAIRDQARRRFETALRDRFSVIMEVKGSDRLVDAVQSLRGRVAGWPDGGVVFATPQLLERAASGGRWYRLVELLGRCVSVVIFDEAHIHYMGKKTRPAIGALLKSSEDNGMLRVAMGMTATPTTRLRGRLRELLNIATTDEAMKKGILVGRIRKRRYVTITPTGLGSPMWRPAPSSAEWRVANRMRAERYAERIVECLLELSGELDARIGRVRYPKALVVAANVPEAKDLEELIRERLDSAGATGVKVLRADYRSERARDVIREFRSRYREGAVLVTVNMADVGFDDPNLEALFIARRISNPLAYVQVRGRVLRTSRDPENIKSVLGYAVVVDLVGDAPDEVRDRNRLEKAEKGELGPADEARAWSELEGYEGARSVEAPVEVLEGGEYVYDPSRPEGAAPSKAVDRLVKVELTGAAIRLEIPPEPAEKREILARELRGATWGLSGWAESEALAETVEESWLPDYIWWYWWRDLVAEGIYYVDFRLATKWEARRADLWAMGEISWEELVRAIARRLERFRRRQRAGWGSRHPPNFRSRSSPGN